MIRLRDTLLLGLPAMVLLFRLLESRTQIPRLVPGFVSLSLGDGEIPRIILVRLQESRIASSGPL